MTKFNVGDKVKVLRQDGLIRTYFDNIDGVFEVVDVLNTREYLVRDCKYIQAVHEDDLAPYTSPQEDDEWGPWVVDCRDWVWSTGVSMVEYGDDGYYVRHKVKKPVPKKQIEVGGSYVSKNNPNYLWECIYIDGDKAWMRHNDNTAYVWSLEGKSISLNENYDIDFSKDPEYDRVPF